MSILTEFSISKYAQNFLNIFFWHLHTLRSSILKFCFLKDILIASNLCLKYTVGREIHVTKSVYAQNNFSILQRKPMKMILENLTKFSEVKCLQI